ncbi:hypothetical protein SAMN04487783_1180 [Agrococcus baldri]|uniref:Uncharacterized protein n=1 Tax=Agrococcus baldri TaxID=153730 RepID=A0AA94HLZ9_9MICO|nr:hypothetical protein [Agrococcus baldri]SFS08924.1 hypothetical protein SAMN04487783_1180 [Agrococcus baldri]
MMGSLGHGEPDGPLPEIPSLDEVGAAFPVLLATLVPQPSIREIGVNTFVSSGDGVVDAQAAAIMYAIFWNPDDLDDPINHVVLTPELEAALANPSPRLPASAVEWIRWLRFPVAYEAVQTQVPGRGGQALPERLALHMRNVIGNTFREQRRPDPHEPWTFVDPPSAHEAAEASVIVDGAALPAISIDDEHVLGLGVELDDAVALIVWPKHLLPLVRLELTRRPRA